MHDPRSEGIGGSALAPEDLLAGPRGRRFLLEYALESDRHHDAVRTEDSFSSVASDTAFHLDPGAGRSLEYLQASPWYPADRTSISAQKTAHVSTEETAVHLERLSLAEVTPELLMQCLSGAVDAAMYWQPPSGEDVLAASGPMREALSCVAHRVVQSAHTQWWCSPMEAGSQWSVQWEGAPPNLIPADPHTMLAQARHEAVESEARAAQERPQRADAAYSGIWDSTPSWKIPSSTRTVLDGSPLGLWLEEDSMGWETAQCSRLSAPPGLRIYEIDSSMAWADLCRRFPLEQTAEKRHDWRSITGRDGRWVIPDWAAVAEHYHAVHLPVSTYLSAAGTAIPVDDQTASVIAGWAPDKTYWFSPDVRYYGDPVSWIFNDNEGKGRWEKKDSPSTTHGWLHTRG